MVLGAGKELAGAVRSANRAVVEWLDRSPASLVLVAGFSAGAAWGVFARFWMRFITTHEEFSWSGTTFIVVAFGVATVGQAGMYLARRSQMTRRGFLGPRQDSNLGHSGLGNRPSIPTPIHYETPGQSVSRPL